MDRPRFNVENAVCGAAVLALIVLIVLPLISLAWGSVWTGSGIGIEDPQMAVVIQQKTEIPGVVFYPADLDTPVPDLLVVVGGLKTAIFIDL